MAGVVYSAPERWAIDLLDDPRHDFIGCFTPNDGRIGLKIPYEYQDGRPRVHPGLHDPVQGRQSVNNHGGFGLESAEDWVEIHSPHKWPGRCTAWAGSGVG